MKPFIKTSLIFAVFITGWVHVSAQQLSEQDIKVNVTEISNSTSKLMQLKPVSFEYDLKKFPQLKLTSGRKYGFLSADLGTDFPELLMQTVRSYESGKNNFKTLTYTEVNQENLIPLLVATVKEQQEAIDLLKKELDILKDKKGTSSK